MTRSLIRLGTLVAGIAMPLCVLAVTAPSQVEETLPSLAPAPASTLELDAALESARAAETVTVLDQFGEPRQIPAELLTEEASQESATRCCWVYYGGFWWCIPCQ
jgi:hypothetical protein